MPRESQEYHGVSLDRVSKGLRSGSLGVSPVRLSEVSQGVSGGRLQSLEGTKSVPLECVSGVFLESLKCVSVFCPWSTSLSTSSDVGGRRSGSLPCAVGGDGVSLERVSGGVCLWNGPLEGERCLWNISKECVRSPTRCE